MEAVPPEEADRLRQRDDHTIPSGRIPSGGKPGATRQQVERRERFERARRDSLRPAADGPVVMYGWHTVTAALRKPGAAACASCSPPKMPRAGWPKKASSRQSRRKIVRPAPSPSGCCPTRCIRAFISKPTRCPRRRSRTLPAQGVVLVLDQITDPHNVGAIFRSAAAFAAAAIVTTQRHSPDATGALAKAASGALEYVPLVSVQNLARALAALKHSGFLVVGLDGGGDVDLATLPLRAPLALVLGAEGKGLRQLTKETCDSRRAHRRCRATIKSLNVSNAAALGLYVAQPRNCRPAETQNGGPPARRSLPLDAEILSIARRLPPWHCRRRVPCGTAGCSCGRDREW